LSKDQRLPSPELGKRDNASRNPWALGLNRKVSRDLRKEAFDPAHRHSEGDEEKLGPWSVRGLGKARFRRALLTNPGRERSCELAPSQNRTASRNKKEKKNTGAAT